MVCHPKSLSPLTFWTHNLYNLCSITKNNNYGLLLLLDKGFKMRRQPKPLQYPTEPPKLTGRDELNFAEFPIASLSHRVPEDCKQLVFEDEIRDQATGLIVPRKLIVTGHATLGLPNSLDDDVVVVLMHLTKERNNFTSRTVPFHRMETVEMLGWPRTGQSIDRLEESLSRWHGVSLRYENAWWDKAAQGWRTEEFHILDNISSFDKKPGRRPKHNPEQTSLPLSTFTWNEAVFRSFQAGNVKSIDLDMYFKLSLAQSRRAYRFLDKRFYRDTELKFDLKSFATGKIGFSGSYSAAKIKEKLQPALDELEGVGFLEPMSRENRYEKISHGIWKIVLVRGNEAKGQEVPATVLESELPLAEPPLVAALEARGVKTRVACELVQQFPAEYVESKIEAFDFEMTQLKPPKKPAGYLVRSIQDGYDAHPNFVSAADRRKGEELRQAREQREAEARREKHQQEAAEKAKDKRDACYWESLTPHQQAELQTKIDGEADPSQLVKETGPLKRMGQTIRRREYLRRLLDGHETGLSGQ
jgi:hypothetical protein